MNKPVILFDLDETVFPFLETWDQWLRHRGELGVDWDAFVWFYDLDLYLSKHIELQPLFAAALAALDPQPIAEALQVMSALSQRYTLIACTARNAQDWSPMTEEWVTRHLPWTEKVIFTRETRGGEATPKQQIAADLGAVALIDDTAAWTAGLQEPTQGIVIRRPYPLASDSGAISWPEALERLTRF